VTSTLYQIAAMLGVTVIFADLTHLGRDGDYNAKTNTIRLQEGMSSRLLRSVFAHELCHAVWGDVPSRFGPVNAKQERRADEWAALRLIDLDDYREVEHLREGNIALMAQDLEVIDDIVRAYQRILQRFGDTIYVAPRMGVGQWTHKVEAHV
jgi:hypothetical protein